VKGLDFWIVIGVIAVTGIITDMISKNKKIEVKRIEAELKLEQKKFENYERETEKLRLELEHSKQLLLEDKGEKK
jgi:F0F1-type ATP synthase epsilon subunit